MSATLNNGLNSLNRIKNYSITRIVKSESADDNLQGYVVVCSECAIEESSAPLRAMTAVAIGDDSRIQASPSLISGNARVSVIERAQLEIEISECTVALLRQLKAKSQLDPKKLEVVSDDEFSDMLSECC